MTMMKRATPGLGVQVRSNYQVGGGEADKRGLFDLAKKNGTKFVEVTRALIQAGKLKLEDFDLRALFVETIDISCNVRAFIPGVGERTLTTSAFPILTGNLIAELLDRPDETAEAIWPRLVTVRPTNKDTTHLVRVINSDSSHQGGNKRKEGDPYPLMVSGEERVQVDTVDDGRRIAIGQKLIETNDMPGLIEQVNALREWANERRDQTVILRAYDVYGSGGTPAAPYVYRPNGAGTALYTTTTTAHRRAPSGTRVVNNAIVDGDSFKPLIDVLANMRNENGNRVSALGGLECLAPHALSPTIDKILASEYTPGVENEVNPYGPRGRFKITPIYSPKIDGFTTSSVILARTFSKFLTMVTRVDMEYVSMAASMQDFLRNRLALEARIADEFEVGARDHNRAVQSLADATAPTGPALGS